MTVADDLRAARALIDSPEKLEVLGVVDALDLALPDKIDAGVEDRFLAMLQAVRAARPAGHLIGLRYETHPDILALFDRAIATAEAHP